MYRSRQLASMESSNKADRKILPKRNVDVFLVRETQRFDARRREGLLALEFLHDLMVLGDPIVGDNYIRILSDRLHNADHWLK